MLIDNLIYEKLVESQIKLTTLCNALWDCAELNYTRTGLRVSGEELYKIAKYLFPNEWEDKFIELKEKQETIEKPF